MLGMVGLIWLRTFMWSTEHSAVLQVYLLWWLGSLLHLCVLLLLLLRPFRHDGFHADILLLWLHDNHLLWCIPHAWSCGLQGSPDICTAHIQSNQVRVARH